MPASILIQPTGIDGCDLQFEEVTNGINHYILSPGEYCLYEIGVSDRSLFATRYLLLNAGPLCFMTLCL